MDSEIFESERDFAEGLNCVDVENSARFLDNGGNFFEVPEDPGFVVRPNERDERGVGTDRGSKVVEIDLSVGVDCQASDLESLTLQMLAKSERCAVLDRAGDDVAF